MFGEIYPEHLVAIGDHGAVVHVALGVEPLGDAGLFEQPHKALFEHAARIRASIVPGLALQHHAVDPARCSSCDSSSPEGSAAYDDHLRAHRPSPVLVRPNIGDSGRE